MDVVLRSSSHEVIHNTKRSIPLPNAWSHDGTTDELENVNRRQMSQGCQKHSRRWQPFGTNTIEEIGSNAWHASVRGRKVAMSTRSARSATTIIGICEVQLKHMVDA